MKKYYLHDGIDQQGPFGIEELKLKNISRETPIWYDGLPEWTTVEKIYELKILLNSTPPPFQNTVAKTAKANYQPEMKKNNLSLFALIIAGIIILILGLIYLLKNKSTNIENNLNKVENSNKDSVAISSHINTQLQIEKTPKTLNKSSLKEKLIGNHNFGIQFIWDGYGTANISNNGTNLIINGSQYSKDNTEYCKINGEIEIVNEQTLNFTGNITIFTQNCCGLIDINGGFTFVKTGNRKYWRLQKRNKLCDEFTCCYYLDIFQ